MKILEVYVYIADKNYGVQRSQVFVSEDALLAYIKEHEFPKAKNLRLKQWTHSNQFSLLNWNTPLLWSYDSMIFKAVLQI